MTKWQRMRPNYDKEMCKTLQYIMSKAVLYNWAFIWNPKASTASVHCMNNANTLKFTLECVPWQYNKTAAMNEVGSCGRGRD